MLRRPARLLVTPAIQACRRVLKHRGIVAVWESTDTDRREKAAMVMKDILDEDADSFVLRDGQLAPKTKALRKEFELKHQTREDFVADMFDLGYGRKTEDDLIETLQVPADEAEDSAEVPPEDVDALTLKYFWPKKYVEHLRKEEEYRQHNTLCELSGEDPYKDSTEFPLPKTYEECFADIDLTLDQMKKHSDHEHYWEFEKQVSEMKSFLVDCHNRLGSNTEIPWDEWKKRILKPGVVDVVKKRFEETRKEWQNWRSFDLLEHENFSEKKDRAWRDWYKKVEEISREMLEENVRLIKSKEDEIVFLPHVRRWHFQRFEMNTYMQKWMFHGVNNYMFLKEDLKMDIEPPSVQGAHKTEFEPVALEWIDRIKLETEEAKKMDDWFMDLTARKERLLKNLSELPEFNADLLTDVQAVQAQLQREHKEYSTYPIGELVDQVKVEAEVKAREDALEAAEFSKRKKRVQ